MTNNNLSVFLLLLSLSPLVAQQQPAAPGAAALAPTAPNSLPAPPVAPALPTNVPGPTGATAPVDNTSSALDYLFNRKPQDGSAAQAASGVAGGMGDKLKAGDLVGDTTVSDPVAEQRFEIYLKHQEIPESRIKEYADKTAQLSATLKTGTTFAAWKMLYALSEYQDLDAGISRELANRVEAVWNTVRTNSGIDQKNDKLRHDINSSDRNADMIAEELRVEDNERKSRIGNQGGQRSNPAAPPTPDSGGGPSSGSSGGSGNGQASMQLTAEYLAGLENRARIKLNEVQQDADRAP